MEELTSRPHAALLAAAALFSLALILALGASSALADNGTFAFQNETHELRVLYMPGNEENSLHSPGLSVYGTTSPAATAWLDGFWVAYASSSTSQLWMYRWTPLEGSGEFWNTGLGVKAATSPAIAEDHEAAFMATNGELTLYNKTEGAHATGLGMEQSNPAIASNGYEAAAEVAFEAAGSHHLWLYSRAAGGHDTGLGIEAGTNPSIAALTNGAYEVAFVGEGTHKLWLYSTATGLATNTGYTVTTGTSPAVSAEYGLSGAWAAAFSGTNQTLSTYTWTGTFFQPPVGVHSATGPGIAQSVYPGYEVGFERTNGTLGTYNPELGARSWNYHPSSSPGVGFVP